MPKRTELFTTERLEGITSHHPYLFLFQKEDWREYLVLFAEIYDLLEDDNIRLPFEAVRTIVLKFYAPRQLSSVEGKIGQFFSMAIAELRVLQDSHDQFGNRFIETTRWGRHLMQLIESLLSQRTRYSGTGAEALLGSLNDILTSRQQITKEEALSHHREKIKSYQKDIQRIQEKGLDHAELLPIPHSNEALFSQAEEAAIHILSSIEDVKTAIEKQRQELAAHYFEGHKSAGQSLHAVAEFYELLFLSPEYASYIQAKRLLSYLEGYTARFSIKNVGHLLHKIREGELISEQEINRSQLRGFMNQFSYADHSIQEKIKSQIKLLQQQVLYAINTDIRGLQKLLHDSVSSLLSNKSHVIDFFEKHPIEISVAAEFDIGQVQLFEFDIPVEPDSVQLSNHTLEFEEQKALFLALMQAEETTLQQILKRLLEHIYQHTSIELENYRIEHGLAEYYVLCEADLFEKRIIKTPTGQKDLPISTKYGEFILRQVPVFKFSLTDGGFHDDAIE